MQTNKISAKTLNADAQSWIEKLRQVLLIQDKGKGTVKNYSAEMILLFKYYNNKTVADISQEDIQQYIIYIKTVHQVGRAKCRCMASAAVFFYKQVIKMPYVLPSTLYPQKQFILPNIMSQQDVTALFAAPLTLKEYCVVGLLYGSGLRISEVAALCIADIESANKRIKVVQGKGAKDRYTLLADNLLDKLRLYYVAAKRPPQFLFTSPQTGKAFHPRSMQLVVTGAMKKAGFGQKPYTSHTLRHSFATHMLDNGSNLHVIKYCSDIVKLKQPWCTCICSSIRNLVLYRRWINYWEVVMEQQPLSELRQLLQQKIFGHQCAESFNPYGRAIFNRLCICHTGAIGVHHLKCTTTTCDNNHYQYHSCGDRHCPNCGGIKKEQWLQDRMCELLPTTYYHLVFTLPQELRSLVMGNRTLLFNLLFDAGHHTINKLGADKKWLGAKPGIVSILHTNG